MTQTESLGGVRESHGFTVLELLVYLALSGIAVGAALSVLTSQTRHFRQQLEIVDVAETLRGAMGTLVWDLKQVAPGRGDIYEIWPQRLKMRSMKGGADICAVHVSKEKYGVWNPAGDFDKNDKDSALVYNGAAGWVAVKLKKTWDDPVAADVPSCDWNGNPAPHKVIEVTKVGLGAGHTGATIRMFQQMEYGMFWWADRWWLGARVAGQGYEVLTGPLRSPADSGLAFHYYDDSGAPTTDPAAVARVEIVLRAESQGTAPTRRDSLVTSVFVGR